MCSIDTNSCVRAAIYARVSSQHQAQTQTIASQVEALQERLRGDGVVVEPEGMFLDDGYSGSTLVRPALERLRDTAAAGGIERLYVYSPDRLSRKQAYQVLLLEEFRSAGVEVVFLNHQAGDSPEGQLLLQVQGMVAEYERALILERSRRGRLHAARHGSVKVLTGAPYGYRYLGAGRTDVAASYEIVLDQAGVVRQMFTWVGRDGLSIREVCRRLQNQGIRTVTGQARWSRGSVWQILKNPAYKGLAAYGKRRRGPLRPRLRPRRGGSMQLRHACSLYQIPPEEWISIPVPAIVEPELFDAVQEQLADNRLRRRERLQGARHLLAGLLVCETCGHAYCGMRTRRRNAQGRESSCAYYRCIGNDARQCGGQRICWNRPVRGDRLEEAVWRDVCSLLREPQRLAREYERRLAPPQRDQSLASLKTLIHKVKRGIGRLIDAYENGLIDRAEFESRLDPARRRQQQLDEQIVALAAEHSRRQDLQLVVGQIETFARQLEGSLEQADWSTKQQVIRMLVKQIEIGEQIVKVVYKVDNLPFAQAPERGRLQHCPRRESAKSRGFWGSEVVKKTVLTRMVELRT
jgi:site-specific DNA recombinase